MWHPVKIEIKNLLSHKQSVYSFVNNSCTVIYGKNVSDRGMENNGSGKSTIFEAISLAYSGMMIREGVDKEKFINRDEEDCYISFWSKNEVLNRTLQIERFFFRGKKASKVKLYENGELNKEITSVNEANKRIVELIGITREDLTRYFIISQDSRYSFFSAGDGEKKEIINRITSADQLSPVLKTIEEELKRYKTIYNDLNSEVSNLTGKIELLDEQKEELVGETSYDEEKEAIEDEIKKYNKEIKEFKKEKEELEKSIKSLSTKKKGEGDLDKKYKSQREELKKERNFLEEDENLLIRINRQSIKEMTCPKCGEKFFPGNDSAELNPEELKAAKEEVEEEIFKRENNIKSLEYSFLETKKKITALEAVKQEMEDRKDDLSLIDRKIRRLESWLETTKDNLDKLKENGNAKEIEVIEQKKKEIEKELKAKRKEMEEATYNIDSYNFWAYNMGKNGFMTYLANQSIKVIEGTVNSYLNKFNTDLSLLINGFKVLADGSIRDKIDIFIQDATGQPEAFSGYSGGERGRTIIAGILAINKLINMSTNGKGLNLLCLDESLPGIDALGQKEIIKVLEKIGVTIMVVTQNVGKEANFSNVLYVEKRNKVSKYINYDGKCAKGEVP